MLLYVIRHGDPDYQNDCLTELGRKQAKALVSRFAKNGLDRIYSSPQGRAKQTAAPTAEALGLPVETEDWMAENNAWQYFTCPTQEGKRDWVFRQRPERYADPTLRAIGEDGWQGDDAFEGTKIAEGFAQIKEHSDEFLARQGYVKEGNFYRAVRPSADRVAVFCHQGFGLSWMSYLLGIPPQFFYPAFDILHTGVIAIRFNEEIEAGGIVLPRCLGFSDTSHLFADADLDVIYQKKISL